MCNEPTDKASRRERGRSVELEWTTISYRTIAIYLVLALLLLLGILYLISPHFVINTATRVLESVAANPTIPPIARRAGRKRTS